MRKPQLPLLARTFVAMSLIGITASSAVQADEGPKVQLIKAAGQPVRLQFPDGREAVLKVSSIATEISIPLSISENTCNDKVGTACKYVIPNTNKYFFFAWTKHPDASKLNRELVLPATENGSERKLEFTTLLTSLQKQSFASVSEVKSTPDQYLTCGDYDWFEPNDPTSEGARRVRQISSETTTRNTETKVDENRFLSTVRDVTFAPVANGAIRVNTANLGAGAETNIPLLFFGDSAWYVKSRSGDVCQYSVRANFTDAQSQFSEVEKKKRAMPEVEKTVYVYGQTLSDRLFRIDSNTQDLMYNAERAQ